MFFIEGDIATTSGAGRRYNEVGNISTTYRTDYGWDGAMSRSLRGPLRLA